MRNLLWLTFESPLSPAATLPDHTNYDMLSWLKAFHTDIGTSWIPAALAVSNDKSWEVLLVALELVIRETISGCDQVDRFMSYSFISIREALHDLERA